MKKFFLYVSMAVILQWSGACTEPYGNVTADCPACPNNTECIDSDCGCPDDKHDMGSWCLPKRDNLFVAASLDCYCMDVTGLYLWRITPETDPTGGVELPQSTYWITGRGTVYSSGMATFNYYDLPDGDSIVIYNARMPNENTSDCWISSNMRCSADIYGKFHGPDTIQAQVVWGRCREKNGSALNFREVKPLTFIRKR